MIISIFFQRKNGKSPWRSLYWNSKKKPTLWDKIKALFRRVYNASRTKTP